MPGRADTEKSMDEMIGVVLEFYWLGPQMRALLPSDALPGEMAARLGHGFLEREGRESRRAQDHEMYYRVGGVLRKHQSMTMTQISESLAVPQSTATRLIDNLVERGLAERTSDPADRRVVRVALSPEGADLIRAFDQHVRARLHEALAALTAEELHTLVTLLRKLVQGLRAMA